MKASREALVCASGGTEFHSQIPEGLKEMTEVPLGFKTYQYMVLAVQFSPSTKHILMMLSGLEFGRSQRAVENRKKLRKLVVKSSMVPQ